MVHTLLRTNPRIATSSLMAGTGCLVVGLALLATFVRRVTEPSGELPGQGTHGLLWVGFSLALALIAVSVVWLRGSITSVLHPPLALTDAALRVKLHANVYEVPLDVVECFFIGQHSAGLKPRSRSQPRIESVTVVVRLAEKAAEWKTREVDARLGIWNDGYITVFGLWCEPLDGDFVKEMNHVLALAKRERKSRRDG